MSRPGAPPPRALKPGDPPYTLESELDGWQAAAEDLLERRGLKPDVNAGLQQILSHIATLRDWPAGETRELWLVELGGMAERLHFQTYQTALDGAGGRAKARNAQEDRDHINKVLLKVVAAMRRKGLRGGALWREVGKDERLVDLKPRSLERRYSKLMGGR